MVRGPRGEMRIKPLLPAHEMKTFEIRQPIATHFREATCQEVECKGFREDMRVEFDLTIPQQVHDANWLRNKSGLRFTYVQTGTKVLFIVPSGQRCLASMVRPHRVPLERDPLMIVRGGDWRGNPRREGMRHTSPESFVDHWASDLDRLATEREKG